jgi:hypothetical protein
MGWLNATIEMKGDKSKRPTENRLMRHNAAKTPAPFVELDAGEYLLNLLMEAGPIKSQPMGGFQALDWVDFAAYASLTMADLEPWEATILRKMSEAFVTGMNEGASPFSIPPADRDSAK